MKTRFLLLLLAAAAVQARAQYVLKFSPLSYASSPVAQVPELFATTASKNVMWVGCPELGLGTTCNYARTTNAGVSFTKGTIPETGSRGIIGITAVDSNTAWALTTDPTGSPTGSGSAIWKTSNGGTGWTKQTTTQFAAPGFGNFIHFFNKDTGVAGGDPNGGYWEIYTTVNGGTTWARVAQASVPSGPPNETGTYNCFSAVGKNIWFGTSTGRAVYSNNYGQTWAAATVTSTPGGTGIEMSDANNGVAWDLANGDLSVTTNGGAAWTPKTVTPAGIGWVSAVRNIPGTYCYKIPGMGYYVTTNNFTGSTLISSTIPGNVKGMKMFDHTLGWSQSSLKADSAVVRIVGNTSAVNNTAANIRQASLFPNPVTADGALVAFSLVSAGVVELQLSDVAGHIVRRLSEQGRTGENAVMLNCVGLPAGLYVLSIHDGKGAATLKVIRQ